MTEASMMVRNIINHNRCNLVSVLGIICDAMCISKCRLHV